MPNDFTQYRDDVNKRMSLCMIVRNEEQYIQNCLRSVNDIVDEIVIVDTGSTDSTKDICSSFGARIIDYTWNDDFASARNYGLDHATGDWILWLDADEEIDTSDRSVLKKAVEEARVDLLAIQLVNYVGDTPTMDEAYQISQVRLFRNYRGIRFENKIHERLTIDGHSAVNIPVRVHHYGYMVASMESKKKYDRNVRLLKRELSEEAYSPWIHYHLASEYYNAGQYEESFEQVNTAIYKFLISGLKPPSLLYRLKYSILLLVGSIDTGLIGIEKAILMYPDYVDLYFFQGLFLMVKKDYQKAKEVFETCVQMGENNLNHLTLCGVGSFKAWFYIGQCCENMGLRSEAEAAYLSSTQLSSTFSQAHSARPALDQKS